jgi:hypothetical protein
MVVPFGLFRKAVREPAFRTVPGPATNAPIVPIGTFRKAICTYHQSGRAAAIAGISLPSSYWRTDPRGKTLAENYRRSLDTYIELDIADGRRSYDVGVKQPITISGEVLNVYMDALVYAVAEHTARIALWDVPQPSATEAAVMASPIVTALEEEVGEERAHSVAFWHLRSATVIEISANDAHTQAARAADAIRRAAGV